MSEKQLSEKYLSILYDDFTISTEVKGCHFSGKKMRLDAVVKPRDVTHWKNKDVSLGIEFKDSERYFTNYDTKNYTKWLAQCVDYTNTEWNDFEYIYIFTCPGILKDIPDNIIQDQMFFTHFFGQLGIGELTEIPGYGLTFALHNTHRMWSKNNGVEQAKTWSLKRKFGSK